MINKYMTIMMTKWSYRKNGLRMWTFGISMKLTRVKRIHPILEITRTASSYPGVQEMCILPAQREACVQNATVNLWIDRFWTVGGSVWEL
jgi:hypothetical protein